MKRILPLLLFVILLSITSKGGSVTSTDVTYRHLKNMEYEVTIVFYRDCRGIPIGVYDLTIYNDSFSITTKTTRTKIQDISTYCKNKACNPSNTTVSGLGIEAHYMMDTIDFNSGIFKKFISKNYCNVYFALNTCCRSGAITTISPGNAFVESMLNLCEASKRPITSPQFQNTIAYYAICNQPFSYSFYTGAANLGDSVTYELVKAKNDANSYENYQWLFTETMPVTPYCVIPGQINCTPNSVTLPIKGSIFNPKNGNFLVTPSKCDDVAVMVGKVNTYRKVNGQYILVSYIKRDMMVVISKTNYNKPTLSTYRDYTIKARENVCIDIKVKDDTTKTNKDTVKLIVWEFPKYGKLSLVDSNAREKTMRFCWNVGDSDYLKKREANIAIFAFDKPCALGQEMSTVVNIRAVAPDSLSNIIIKTYFDKNKNGKKDVGEFYKSASISSINNTNFSIYQTDNSGVLYIKPLKGKYQIGINRNQFASATNKDSIVMAKFDSTHMIELGFTYSQGIKGKVFEDVNNNCTYESGIDILLEGIKITSKASNGAALTDKNGDYLFNGSTGSYTVQIDSISGYKSTCNPSRTAIIVKDSQFLNYNFPMKKKVGFKDISISLTPENLIRNNVEQTQIINIENLGLNTVSQFYVKLLTSVKLNNLSSSNTIFYKKDTIIWVVDSITKGNTKSINFSHFILKDSFKKGDQINYQLWADIIDSLPSNNYFELRETINDSNCCGSEKRIYVANRYYPVNKTITYKINFIPTANTKRAFITDTLDANRFDLRSLRLLGSNLDNITYLNKNVLTVDIVNNNSFSNTSFTYCIDLKTPNDSFIVTNKATALFDNQAIKISNTVETKIISPITYDSLNNYKVCENDNLIIKFKTNYKPEKNNHFKVYMSDSSGQFSQPYLLLDTLSYSFNNDLKIHLPKVFTSNTYKLKVMGTLPVTEAFPTIALPTIILNPLPKIQFTTNLINGKICLEDTFKLQASGAQQYKFFNYNKPTNAFSTQSDYAEKILNNGNYEITYKSSEGCLITSPVINVGIFQLPKIKLSTSRSILCDGDQTDLKYTGANTYQINRNSNNIIAMGLTTSPYLIIPPLNSSFYSVVGTDLNGCKDTSNSLIIKVNGLPSPPFITRINKALKSSYSKGNQWYLNGIKIDSAVNPYFYPQQDGLYSVKYIDSNSCENISSNYNVNYTSIVSIAAQNSYVFYPNPTSNNITIETSNESIYNIELFNSFGQLVLKETGYQNKIINLENYSNGNYTMRLSSNNSILHFKITLIK